MDVRSVQAKLNEHGASLVVDGDLGPNTYASMLNYVTGRDLGSIAVALGRAMSADFPKYSILTDLRLSHFIAQAAHETGGFKFFYELGSADYLKRYDGRLGNKFPGDGARYKGRGIFQLTGRSNYEVYENRIGVDLVDEPDRAAEPEIAVLIACLYWKDHNLNSLADQDNVQAITRAINGGLNGLDQRKQYLGTAKSLLL